MPMPSLLMCGYDFHSPLAQLAMAIQNLGSGKCEDSTTYASYTDPKGRIWQQVFKPLGSYNKH